MRRRRADVIAAAVVAVVAVGAGVGLIASARRGPARADLQDIANAIAARADEAATAARTRVEVAAALPRLVAALATDEATLRDLSDGDLGLQLAPGEILEVAQRFSDGRVQPLTRRPATAPAVATLREAGAALVVAGDTFYAVATRSAQPLDRADELTGMIAVAHPLALDYERQRLDALGAGARIVTRNGRRSLGHGFDGERGARASLPDGGSVLVAAGERPLPLAPIGAGVIVLGAVASLLLMRRRETKPEDAAPMQPMLAHLSSPITPPANPEVPVAEAPAVRELGRYAILGLVGRGGMADVYLARANGEAGFEKRVALKVLRPEQATDRNVVEHFLDEARVASTLAHPNIVQIFDLGRAGNDYFIAMEFVDGADLGRIADAHRFANVKMPPAIALAILRQICAGLHAAHTAVDQHAQPLGIVHRDVKSANVFVASNGVVKIGDFGIAKARETVRSTRVGEVKGTAEYMAPEQRTGNAVDARADQYGVGAIAYELLSGEMINLDLARLAHLGQRGWPHLAPLEVVRPELPRALGELVFRVLAYDREQRFATCEHLEDAIIDVAQHHGLVASERAVAAWFRERAALWRVEQEILLRPERRTLAISQRR